MPEVFISWNAVANAEIGGQAAAGHLFLVFRPSANADYSEYEIIRGGPDPNATQRAIDGVFVGDTMVTEVAKRWPESADSLGQVGDVTNDQAQQYLVDRGRLIAQGDNASILWEAMKAYSENVNDRFSYKAIDNLGGGISQNPTLNSNAFVNSVLYHVGLDYSQLTPPSLPALTPGRNNLLGTTRLYGDSLLFP